MMDIFSKWREGKKKHDERVDANTDAATIDMIASVRDRHKSIGELQSDLNTALIMLRQVGEARSKKEITKEALLWKTLGDYALGMADLQSKDKPRMVATIKGSDIATAFGRATKRKFFMDKSDCPHTKCECGVKPNGDVVYCNPNAAKAHVDAISKASNTQYGQDHPSIKFDPEITKRWSEVNELIKKNAPPNTQYGQTQVVNSPTNARVKRQDPLKEELRERRENGIRNEAGV